MRFGKVARRSFRPKALVALTCGLAQRLRTSETPFNCQEILGCTKQSIVAIPSARHMAAPMSNADKGSLNLLKKRGFQ